MDGIAAEMALQAILGRTGDFIGGIDNEALDFSQLEAFINSEGAVTSGYFSESLSGGAPNAGAPGTPTQVPTGPIGPLPTGGKLLNVIVENKRQTGHSLPDSPPDSGSEHPYSPPSQSQEIIYTNLGHLGGVGGEAPLITHENLILTNSNILHDPRLLITSESNDAPPTRQILIPASQGSPPYPGEPYNPIDNQLIEDVIYTNLQVPKKRKLSQEVKSEPEIGEQAPPLAPNGGGSPVIGGDDPDYATSESGGALDAQYQCIRFQAFQQSTWHVLCDQNLAELPVPHYRVDADKGFNFSNADEAFVCQKKNHFQITCHVQLIGDAQFVKTSEGLQKINSFHLHFYGVKYDCPTQTIRVEQSQSDRSKKPFHPVLVSNSRVELVGSQVTKVTVGRLHFSETTSNNMRKKGKPNPEQRYFQLVVGLHAHTSHGHFPVASHASQRIIVRASNPGQFESDVELCWQKGQTQESIFHAGKVGINTDRPDESLVIHGNLKITGHIIQPSDFRAKKNIIECDTAEQLRNVQKLRVVRYEYTPGFASQLNLTSNLVDTGVIAQEVAEIIPDAVRPTGDIILENGNTIDNFLVVNKERIFMENVGAVKELCRVTDNLETRIGQLERINRRLNKLKRDDSLKSTSTVCSKKTKKDPEFCSNKFIHIVIVILVLIMAFCLAAITTLYLMEASRHNQLAQNNVFKEKAAVMNRKLTPLKNQLKPYQSSGAVPHQRETPSNKGKGNDLNIRPSIENTIPSSKLPMVIGKPPYCSDLDADLENHGCQVYCCAPGSPLDHTEVDSALYEKTHNSTQKQMSVIRNLDKNQIHSNEIGKRQQQRQRNKRDADDYWREAENTFLENAEQFFTIFVQGTTFNITLTNDYCYDCGGNSFNVTYAVPISKYMADDLVTVAFRSNQGNYKEIEHCQNEYRQQECPLNYWDDGKSPNHPLTNQNIGIETIGGNKIPTSIFEVGLVNIQYKILTYRAGLIQNQNVCQLSPNKLGIEYIEYNLNFYRDCDEK